MKIKIEDLCKAFGVELEEEFMLGEGVFKFTEKGLSYYSPDTGQWEYTVLSINAAFAHEVEKLPFKPQAGLVQLNGTQRQGGTA